jgi:hypothetical protein
MILHWRQYVAENLVLVIDVFESEVKKLVDVFDLQISCILCFCNKSIALREQHLPMFVQIQLLGRCEGALALDDESSNLQKREERVFLQMHFLGVFSSQGASSTHKSSNPRNYLPELLQQSQRPCI